MTDLLFDENDKVGFNSTLVHLKAMAVTGPGYIINCFNSTLVQLKEDLDRVFCVRLLSFNSTLVQLKGEKFLSDLRVAGLFQFYLSSIKSYKGVVFGVYGE